MKKITKVIITTEDGAELTFIGPGHYKVVTTERTQETWIKNKKDEDVLDKKSSPVRFLDVTMSLPTKEN